MQNTADNLNTPQAAAYFTKNPHRAAALRTTLDLLGMTYPLWAVRERPGRKPAGFNLLGR